MFREYEKLLRDARYPASRVVRKSAAITVVLCVAVAYYRHVRLGFGFGEPMLMTAGLAFILLMVVGMFGGLLAAGFYENFLRDIDARRPDEWSYAVFFAEWLFAACSPILGALVLGFSLGQGG